MIKVRLHTCIFHWTCQLRMHDKCIELIWRLFFTWSGGNVFFFSVGAKYLIDIDRNYHCLVFWCESSYLLWFWVCSLTVWLFRALNHWYVYVSFFLHSFNFSSSLFSFRFAFIPFLYLKVHFMNIAIAEKCKLNIALSVI